MNSRFPIFSLLEIVLLFPFSFVLISNATSSNLKPCTDSVRVFLYPYHLSLLFVILNLYKFLLFLSQPAAT